MTFRVQEISRKLRAYALLLVAAMVSVSFVSAPAQAAAGINGQINFQGRLLTPQGATVPDGYYNVQFKIYQDGDGQTAGNTTGSPAGTLKWTESHLNANSQGVTVKNGYLSVQLGSVTPFGSSVDWNQDTLWLSINIAGVNASCTPFASCSPDGEMLPMKRLSSAPYAMNAGRLGGLASSQFIQSTTVPQAANIAVQSAAANSIGAQVVGAAAQTADIFQVKADSVATSLFAVGAAGATALQNSTDSSAAFTVNNANGRLVLGVDTTAGKVTLGNITSTAGAGVAGTLVLADGTNDNFGLTLASATLTANRTVTLPNESGTVCLQTSASCGFLTGSASDYIQNQNSAQQSSSQFWISGIGRADTAMQAPLFDTATAAALNIGTTNATGINLNQSTTLASGKSLIFASGSFKATFTPAALSADRTITIPDAAGTLAVSASGNIALSSAGNISFTGVLPIANGGTNASTSQAAINNLSQLTTNGDLLYFNGTNSTRLARGANGQCLLSDATTIAWNTCVTAEADTLASVTGRGATTSTSVILQGGATVRGITVDTATATDDKIAVSVTSGGGQSFTGTLTNTDLSAARTWTLPDASGTICLQNSTNCGFLTSTTGVQLQTGTPGTAQTGNFNITGTGIAGTLQSTSLSVTGTAGSANITVGSTGNTGQITFANSTNANTAIIQGGVTTSSYTTVLPDAVGSAGQCLTVGAVAGSTQTLGYVGCLTTANSIELQASTPGVAQTGHFNVTGTGIVGALETTLVKAPDDTAMTIRGGNATVVNANGSNLTVTGGTGNGTGVSGLVNLGPAAFASVVNASCAANCTITQSNIDNYGTIVISATTSDITITLPPPTITSIKGRTIYITTDSSSLDFTLNTNSGADLIEVAMRKNTTSTMIWNGTAWTPGGASNATTLQATYNNGSNPATTPEIKLDSIRGTIDIQDADTTIGTDLFNIRGSNAAGLGTVLFGVSNTGRVTVQDTSDTSSSFRVLNSSGNYLLNVNGYSNYTFDNSIKSVGNQITNAHFESGGAITSGEAGWFGPAQASIVNDAANSHGGNHHLQVTANGTILDVYAGSYFEVVPGEDLYFEGWIKSSAGSSGSAGIQITWYDKDKVVISSSTDYPGNPGTTYVRRAVNAAAPSNAAYARVSATARFGSSGTYYFDDFFLKRSVETSPFIMRNAVDTTTAFRIQSASSTQTLFTANTTDNILKVGDASGTDTQTTILVLDSATSDPTTSLSSRNGGLFYRSDTNSLKAVIGGAVVDICTTAITCTGYSASAGASIQLQATSPGTVQTGNFNITGTGILTKLQTQDQTAASTNSQNLVIRTGNAAGAGSSSGNLTLDTGNSASTPGTITIGHAGVATTVGGTLAIQGGSSLSLGQSATNTGSIQFNTAAGTGTITLRAPGSNPTTYSLTLPTALGAAGECIKTDATGAMYFQGCGVGINYNLQDAYNNSGTPAEILLADGKNLQFTAQDTTTDPSVVVNLQCASSCGVGGKFVVKTTAGDVFTVNPNTGGITLNAYTQIGSSISDGTQVNFQVDSYNGGTDTGTCSATVNQGAMYYNTAMGSLRACLNGAWGDVSNPDTLGLLTFGIVPSSGANPYDLPGLVTTGASGPCKVSWASNTSVVVQPCTAYSNGRRFNIDNAVTLNTNSAVAPHINLTTTNRWGHICLDTTTGQPEFTTTAGQASALAGLPNFSVSQPTLCLADVQGESVTAGRIDNIYDTRTFTSTIKEAVNTTTATELGMLVDSSTTGGLVPSAACSSGTCSGKLYGVIVATDGGTSTGAPNSIIASVGAAYVKAISGNPGEFVKSSTTAGYASTVTAIPNNAFYFSPGNARTTWSTTCTSASNCLGSLYVNFIVR